MAWKDLEEDLEEELGGYAGAAPSLAWLRAEAVSGFHVLRGASTVRLTTMEEGARWAERRAKKDPAKRRAYKTAKQRIYDAKKRALRLSEDPNAFRVRRCRGCSQIGHDRRTCPSSVPPPIDGAKTS